VELAQRVAVTGIRVHVLNPGGADTGIRREIDATALGRAMTTTFALLMTVRTPQESAQAILAAVRAHPDSVLIGSRGFPLRLRRRILDPQRRRELWHPGERAVGMTVLPVR
jgi:NAD(P)-dependent dehydrogenase (short-subunit alcohol dehydrogenase family)